MTTVPDAMRAADRWLRWRLVDRGYAKPAKVPVTTQGRTAKVNDPSTWASFAEAAESTMGKGLGYVLGDGIGCIDLDDAVDREGHLSAWAECLLDALPPTFVEVSQSGHGLHVFGHLAESKGRNFRSQGLSVEVYSAGRYIAVTGDVWEDSPATLADITPLARAMALL